jgi:hypothetical protein
MNRSEIIEQLKADGLSIGNLDETKKADEELVIIALQQNGLALQYLSESQKANKKLVLLAVTQNPFAIQFAATALRDHEKVLTQAYQRYPFWWFENPGGLDVIDYASPAQGTNMKLLLRLLKYDSELIFRFPEHYLHEEYFMQKAVAINGKVIKFASLTIQYSRSIVLAAAKSNACFMLSPPFDQFWTDREIMLAACISDSDVFNVLPRAFKYDVSFIVKVLKNSRAARKNLLSLPKIILHHKEVILNGFELNPDLLLLALKLDKLLKDDDFILKVYEKLWPQHPYFKVVSKLLLYYFRKNKTTPTLKKKVPQRKHALLKKIIKINPATATYFEKIINPQKKESSKTER